METRTKRHRWSFDADSYQQTLQAFANPADRVAFILANEDAVDSFKILDIALDTMYYSYASTDEVRQQFAMRHHNVITDAYELVRTSSWIDSMDIFKAANLSQWKFVNSEDARPSLQSICDTQLKHESLSTLTLEEKLFLAMFISVKDADLSITRHASSEKYNSAQLTFLEVNQSWIHNSLMLFVVMNKATYFNDVRWLAMKFYHMIQDGESLGKVIANLKGSPGDALSLVKEIQQQWGAPRLTFAQLLKITEDIISSPVDDCPPLKIEELTDFILRNKDQIQTFDELKEMLETLYNKGYDQLVYNLACLKSPLITSAKELAPVLSIIEQKAQSAFTAYCQAYPDVLGVQDPYAEVKEAAASVGNVTGTMFADSARSAQASNTLLQHLAPKDSANTLR